MKDCSYFEEQMSGLLDGMLSQEEADMLFAHLAQCPECSALYEDLRRLSDTMPCLEVAPPAGFSDTVLCALRVRAEKRKRMRCHMVSAAAVLLVVLLGAGASQSLWSFSDEMQESAADQETSRQTEVPMEIYTQSPERAPLSCKSEGGEETGVAEGDGTERTFGISGVFNGYMDSGNMASGGTNAPSGGLYFAVLTIQGKGIAKTLNREETELFLQELDANGVSYTYRTEGTEIAETASLCLVCYTSESP